MLRSLLLTVFAAAGFSGCQNLQSAPPILGSAHVVADFDSYTLRRVGLVPIEGLDPSLAESRAMATTMGGEFAGRTGLEVLVLTDIEVSEVPTLTPHRDGRFDANTIIALGRRHRLDALLVASIVDRKSYPPQSIGLQMDLVSTETGISLWYGRIQADAGEGQTRRAVKAWVEQSEERDEVDWKVVLLSPRRFYRFACHEILRQFAS